MSYWKCEAGDTVARMDMIIEIMKVNEIAKEQGIIKDGKEARRTSRKAYLEKLSNCKYQTKLIELIANSAIT